MMEGVLMMEKATEKVVDGTRKIFKKMMEEKRVMDLMINVKQMEKAIVTEELEQIAEKYRTEQARELVKQLRSKL